MTKPVLYVFSSDLRLADLEGLAAAAAQGPVVPLFLWDEDVLGPRPRGAASRAWVARSLAALAARLAGDGGRLLCLAGHPRAALAEVWRATGGVAAIHGQRAYGPMALARTAAWREAAQEWGCPWAEHDEHVLVAPGTVVSKAGTPYHVFTPFLKTLKATVVPAPAGPARPRWWPIPDGLGSSPDGMGLAPRLPWDEGFWAEGTPGEEGARSAWDAFRDSRAAAYGEARDFPGQAGTARLSPHLAWGEISPRRLWHEALRGPANAGMDKWLSELAWREFAFHTLAEHPDLATRELRPEFRAFPWRRDDGDAEAWRRGRTGYPIVDAGMRQLWATGWMHNRVRMIVGSFLVKHLLLDWRVGEAWFWDTLVDACPANNAQSWQWVAGSGRDAAPYFRVFNPVTQARRYDEGGAYVHRWIPELAKLGPPHVHAPWEAPPPVLAAAGVRLGKDYPMPVILPAPGRVRALAAFARLPRKGVPVPSP